MKSIKFILQLTMLACIILTSCQDGQDIRVSNRETIRINQPSIYLEIGDTMNISATITNSSNPADQLQWTILNSDIATIENQQDSTALITAVATGKTIVKVETADKRLMYFADLTITKPQIRIYIDFGPVESPKPFNNYRSPNEAGPTHLLTERGKTTNIGITVDQHFTGTLDRGLGNNLGLPSTASADMFFSDGISIPLSSLKISGLAKDKKYTFTFYGHINDGGTETQFKVIGSNNETAYLVNDFNMDRVTAVKGIMPTDEGTVTIEMSPGPKNTQWARFFGINTMEIFEENN